MLAYSPRRAVAFLVLAGTRRRREAAERLSLTALAAQGDNKAIRKQLKEWQKD